MFKDLRQFIAMLEEEWPEEIIRVEGGPFAPAEGECVALLYHLMKQGKRPLAIFEQVKTLKGQLWKGAVAFQLAGTWAKIGAAYGMRRETMNYLDIQVETVKRMNETVEPIRVHPKDAPIKERVLPYGETDLFDLPAYIANEHDPRPGNITGVIVAKHPDTGRYNLSWHRNRVFAPERMTTALDSGTRHLMDIVTKYRERGEEWVPIAQVFGHHVLFGLGAAIRAGYEVDEYAFVGGIMGEALRLTPSATWGEDFLIPADAEVVIEGYISTHEKAPKGTWGDAFRYYVADRPAPVVRMAAINTRNQPIMEHTWVGQYVYTDIATTSLAQHMLAQRFPTVGTLNNIGPTTIVQFKPRAPGEVGALAGMVHALSAYGKHIIVVDEDVDPFDLGAVLWSISTRVDGRKDVWVTPVVPSRIDPSAHAAAEAGESVGGLVIDSTRPVGKPFLEVAYPSAEVLQRIKVEDWLHPETINRLALGNTSRSWAKL